jgi:hypothetical protein
MRPDNVRRRPVFFEGIDMQLPAKARIYFSLANEKFPTADRRRTHRVRSLESEEAANNAPSLAAVQRRP